VRCVGDEHTVRIEGPDRRRGGPSRGLINVFVHDGTAYTLYDQILVGAIEIDAPTSLAWRQVKHYANLWLTPGWSLRISSTVAGNHVHVVAVGCDLEAVHGPKAPE
jgi:hypothetical protein